MRFFQEPSFEAVRLSELPGVVAREKELGHSFVNLNATVVDEGCELLYAFRASHADAGLTGYTVLVRPGSTVPSITGQYPVAFVFENEAHDLFGIDFDGISIDFEGNLYQLSVAYPMNPRAAINDPDKRDYQRETE